MCLNDKKRLLYKLELDLWDQVADFSPNISTSPEEFKKRLEEYNQILYSDEEFNDHDTKDTFTLSESNCQALKIPKSKCSLPKPLDPSLKSSFEW
jgi:hypothetical protein